ncbi:acetylglutamate kinase [Natronomonas moolapensis 8.8.11]|uniref:Putative [LysW]-aminoadipate/[LysW]-glutamate kinase n=1 Tax=Natronomonas moolapensis (strain DSM 18674 / CECT 7526 / JCM 14361 / 8.8.11) TaxID=268739 RepID=M1XNG2_NATM8|nr:acetylglutamate/acetylaminoadipate kinase [Natronomonas moolapensis]CCQ35450.1 acetylglutamate kinase [Natronomonas moolapensis 8.8.11]
MTDPDTVVVKIGGARAVDPEGALANVASVREDGTDVVVVHGGSTAVDDALERMGVEPEYVETPSGVVGRFTDAETMDVFKMALAGQVNTDLVTGLRNQGVDAVGLSGVDGGLFTGPRKSAVRVVEDGTKKIRRGDHSGTIESVNGGLLSTLLSDGYTPVASPPMLADDGVAVNTDADRAAAAVAAELGGTLVSLTDVAGVYRDPDDPSTVIDRVDTPDAYEELRAAAEGFMGRKVMAATEALEGGAERVVVANANADAPIRSAIDGGGTDVLPSALE